jgi:manganese efflux pump family protein
MDYTEISLIALGLSFDSFAVSVSSGLIVPHIRFWQAFRVALVLAVFQAAMPLPGWFLGKEIHQYISAYDHWAAFALLGLLGAKMIYDSLTQDEETPRNNPLKNTVVLSMALATSMDAMVVGLSFGFIQINIIAAVIIIGIVTFLASMLGTLLGKKTAGRLGKQVEILGGFILIGIGLKILLEHVL